MSTPHTISRLSSATTTVSFVAFCLQQWTPSAMGVHLRTVFEATNSRRSLSHPNSISRTSQGAAQDINHMAYCVHIIKTIVKHKQCSGDIGYFLRLGSRSDTLLSADTCQPYHSTSDYGNRPACLSGRSRYAAPPRAGSRQCRDGTSHRSMRRAFRRHVLRYTRKLNGGCPCGFHI